LDLAYRTLSHNLCERIHKDLVKQDSVTKQTTSAVNEGWMEGGSFFSSTLAGILLGYGADRVFGTDPWFVVIGLIAGACSGFWRVLVFSRRIEVNPRGR
jgi:F0F1-type ATP synthase assembly protein I